MTAVRPWEIEANVLAAQPGGQIIYDRVVSLQRMKTVAGSSDAIGDTGYSGFEGGTGVEGPVTLATGIPASIQVGAVGRTTIGVRLPADAVSKPVWMIYIPALALPQYSIRDRDFIIDDEFYRYQVGANYWTGIGYRLSVIREEA